MRWGWDIGAAVAALGLAGCGPGSMGATLVGTAASGVVTVGQAAVGLAGSVVSAGASAVVGGAQLAGSAAVGAVTGATTAATGTSAAVAGTASGATAAPALAGTAAGTGAGAGTTMAGGVVLTSATTGLSQTGFTEAGASAQALDALGSQALAEAELLLQTPRNPLDSCALEVFREMAKSTGFATAQRWANDLSAQASGNDFLALGGLFMLTSVIRVQVMQVHDDIRRSVQEALDLPGMVDAQTAFAAIRDGQSLCPAGLMGRLSEMTLEA